ncbi:hypothetical protein B0H14DRAFT_2598303 [Mycena olivaceomarginata]|nr:hypothetical protein B0H14DRAFT_2598303 [Mycena olivaceomarginata]
MLLGENKYVWHKTTKAWNDDQGALFAARLQSASLDGLNLSSLRARNMVQYKNSLIGKHFKADLTVAINNVLDRLAIIDPARITQKHKLHVLSHIPSATWSDSNTKVEVQAKSKRFPATWKNTLGLLWEKDLTEPAAHAGTIWISCKNAAARSQGFPGSWIFFREGVEV